MKITKILFACALSSAVIAAFALIIYFGVIYPYPTLPFLIIVLFIILAYGIYKELE